MQILGAIVSVLIIAYLLRNLYVMYKTKPDMFSAKSFGQSFYVTGILALFLIAAIAFTVMILRG